MSEGQFVAGLAQIGFRISGKKKRFLLCALNSDRDATITLEEWKSFFAANEADLGNTVADLTRCNTVPASGATEHGSLRSVQLVRSVSAPSAADLTAVSVGP